MHNYRSMITHCNSEKIRLELGHNTSITVMNEMPGICATGLVFLFSSGYMHIFH